MGVGVGKIVTTQAALKEGQAHAASEATARASKLESDFKERERRSEDAFTDRLNRFDRMLSDKIELIDGKLLLFDAAYAESLRERSDFGARLEAAEKDIIRADTQRERMIDVVDKTREALTGFTARSDEQHKNMREAQDRTFRALSTIERQIANFASGGNPATYPNQPAMQRFLESERGDHK